MKCEVFFYYEKNKAWEKLPEKIKNFSSQCQVITDSKLLNEFLEDEGIKAELLDIIVPEREKESKDVFDFTKNIFSEYKNSLKNLKFHDNEIFFGIQFQFLRQLHILSRAKKILKKNKDTVFVFERFYQSYFVIKKLAEQMGYEFGPHIYIINESNIEEIKLKDSVTKHKNKFALKRSLLYLKSSSDKNKLRNFSKKIYFLKKLFVFGLKKILQKFSSSEDNENIEKIISKFKKKIQKLNVNITTIFFMTATRADLHLKPLLPIFKLFDKTNMNYLICTSDLSTGLMLKDAGITFLSIFEDVKLLSTAFKNSKEGKNLSLEFEKIVEENNNILGFEEFSDFLLEEFFRICGLILLCENLLNRSQLESIWTSSDGEMLENVGIQVAKKNHITSYSSVPAVFFPAPLHSYWFHADKILTYGKNGLDVLINLGYDKNRIIQSGQSKYDNLVNLDSKKSKEFLEKKYGLSRSKKIITVALGIWENNDEFWISELIKFCNKKNYEIVIKIHPTYRFNDVEYSLAKINAIKNSCKNLNFIITDDIDIFKLISASDLVITDFSNVGLEAILVKKPLIIAQFLRQKGWDHLKIEEYQAGIIVKKYDEIEEVIPKIFESEKLNENLKIGREKIVEQFNFKNDGKASERIFQLLTNKI